MFDLSGSGNRHAWIHYQYDNEEWDSVLVDVTGETEQEMLESAAKQAEEMLEEGIEYDIELVESFC